MTGGFWTRVDVVGRNLAPFAVTAMLILASMVPLHLPGYGAVAPELGLMAVYYWTIHRPDLLRPSFSFGLGVMQDLLGGTPLGSTALVYVLVCWLILTRRRFFLSSGFMMLWVGFAIVVLGAAGVSWLSHSLLRMAVLPAAPVIFQALLTLALFPPFAWLFIKVHRAFLQV
jgi:rod shape-determining protein MreD